ncbi:phosphoribosyltransferase [Nocardia sp. NPDC051321]|uniref:phosphoribosyltransferase n=1 Tax=Nocardia sp. NPDC051321 TaxID=3364323 RepID=UPI0037989C2A
MPFLDRHDAGRRLAERLRGLRDPKTVLLALPCGGVPVAYQVAKALDVSLDVAIVRRLTVPYQPSLVFGALAEDGSVQYDAEIIERALVSEPERVAVTREQRVQLRHTVTRFRGDRPRVPLAGATAVIVVDGLDTAVTARAGIEMARKNGASRVLLAAPVATAGALRVLTGVADRVVCLETPSLFGSIRPWYRDFGEVAEAEARALLVRAADDLEVGARTSTVGSRSESARLTR